MATISSRPRTRPPFDPGRAFVALRPLPAGGVKLDPGQLFDKSLVTTRRLKQLFESRAIGFDPNEEVTALPVYVARRGVRLAGRDLSVGDKFPRDAVGPHRLDQMMAQGLLSTQAPRTRSRPARVRREVADA